MRKRGKAFIWLTMFSLIVGALLGLFVSKHYGMPQEKVGVFSKYYLQEYAYLDIDTRKLFWIVAKERSKWMLLLWSFGFCVSGKRLVYLFSTVWGFFAALFLHQAFLKQGFTGISLAVLFSMPQMLIYVPLFFWLMQEAAKKSQMRGSLQRFGVRSRVDSRYVLCFLKAFAVLLLGILTETYLNSRLVQLVLRLIYG